MPKTRILIVEDEFLIRMTLAEVLADEGFDVAEAGTAAEALHTLDSPDSISLMMTDIQLPGGMDGRELARRVRARLPDLPVIYMSGRPEAPGPDATARDLFVTKPYLPSEICEAVRRMIA